MLFRKAKGDTELEFLAVLVSDGVFWSLLVLVRDGLLVDLVVLDSNVFF